MIAAQDRVAGMLSVERSWQRRLLAAVVLLICSVPERKRGRSEKIDLLQQSTRTDH